ncbi:M24 family metallopeptidase [Kibdelosporangium phytohabitans]|uniref:Dipeptidase n=1 Tax=Kibdelosporangium phytohabitans TaxID=860235 RepID=A0A0N9I3V0_9PSEU|nr:Xaa-Pro peptidase family protein [Kibdelosporangium phytohabitans]ALG08985.1 dipeptidase [Kibdelosporangium phytohabitans]MBE1469841.1 Xaa-Pro dipeptidase [Kibdelosporangium phytohabitans]
MSSSTAPVPAPEILRSRLERARQAAADAGFDALLVTPGSDLRYLLGAVGGSFERLTCLVLPVSGQATLVVPKLELPGYEHLLVDELGVDAATWVDGVNPAELAAGLLKSPKRVAVSDFTPALHVLGLRDALAGAEQQLAGPVIRELRMRKDISEVDSLREAGAAIDRVHARMGEFLRAGRTENDVAADIADAIVAEGHTVAEFVIVGSGPNGASPHHGSSDRVIEHGDVVVIDIGGSVAEGYNSDSTRTYAIGTPRDEDVAKTYAVLQQAQQAAVDAVRPGATAQDIDRAARAVIADAGFGEYFIHRTGHGIGLDVHEEPYIVEGNDLVLEEGMAFSVEPGIYQSGRWGARIEDIVVVTADGVESLNTRPHELVVLGE